MGYERGFVIAPGGRVAHMVDSWDGQYHAWAACSGLFSESVEVDRAATSEPKCKKCLAIARKRIAPCLDFLGEDALRPDAE